MAMKWHKLGCIDFPKNLKNKMATTTNFLKIRPSIYTLDI